LLGGIFVKAKRDKENDDHCDHKSLEERTESNLRESSEHRAKIN
jgi:hypothetical protein